MPSISRRDTLALVGSTAIGLAGCLSGGSSSGDLGSIEGDWPVVGRDVGHRRWVRDGPSDPSQVWSTELGDARGAGTPAIANERAYVPVDAVSDRARQQYRLHALDATTGEERWHVPMRADPNPAPAVSVDRVVVTTRRSLEQGRVIGFDTKYGEEEWLYDIDARVTAPPTVSVGTVYVPDWAGQIHALSAADGSVKWARQVDPEGADREFTEPVAVHDGTLYVGSLSGRTGVIAVEARTGEERWSRSTDVTVAGPIVDDELVAVRTHGSVTAFGTDGSERWTFSVPRDDWQTMAMDDKHIYVPARDALHAIHRDGEHAWSFDAADSRIGAPTILGETVAMRVDDELVGLSRDDGHRQWSVEVEGSGEVVGTENALFLAESGGHVTALESS